MHLYFRTELSQFSREIEQLRVPDLRGASDEVKFIATKEKIMEILKILYGENSREFRVVKLTYSPATVVKVVNHIIHRTDMTPINTNVVNM